MAYIDDAYYETEYLGTTIENKEIFFKLANRASDLVDMVTSYRLKGVDFEQETAFLQEQVKKAVASQVEYLYQQGGELSVHGGSLSSVNIGNFSYQEEKKQIISPMAMEYLKPTGLLNRTVRVYGG
jgi:hypothetical protein